MPILQNLSAQLAGETGVQSVRVWLYPSPITYTQTGAMPGGEVNANQAHFVVHEGFTGPDGAGTSRGRGRIDTGTQTAMQAFRATTLEDLIRATFLPSGPPDEQ